MLRKTDLAYLAGFFDGEGSVMIGLNPSAGLKIGIAVSQNTRTVMELYERSFGGAVYDYTPKNRISQIFQWRANGVLAVTSLEQMQPYLLVKRNACERAIASWYHKQKGEDEQWQEIVRLHKEYTTANKMR